MEFANKVDTLYIVEELEPVIEEQVSAMGIKVKGKELFGKQGEITVTQIREKIGGQTISVEKSKELPVRPPVLCPGCPHRGLFSVISKLKYRVMGDIGCYTLGAFAPQHAMDTCICMGASVGMSHGFEKARGKEAMKNTLALIGDSTFIHSGITGLINVVYNQGISTIIIADNGTTGMTGHQNHPGTGRTLKNEQTVSIDIEALCKAIGIRQVVTVNPYDMKSLEKIVQEEIKREEPSVIITKAPCKLLIKEKWETYKVDETNCSNCGICSKLGCPAILKNEKHTLINNALCSGCGLCESVCLKKAVKRGRE